MVANFAKTLTLIFVLIPNGLAMAQELVAWERFLDDSLAANVTCFQETCLESAYEDEDFYQGDATFSPGQLNIVFRGFMMWPLNGLDGNVLPPSNQMSIRARLTASSEAIGLVGVGSDGYYAAATGSPAAGVLDVNAGRYFDGNESVGVFPRDQPWIIQLDVFPDHLEAYSWPVADPAHVIDVYWDRGSDIDPHVPVIWGNFVGEYQFYEVSVTYDGYMGIGGDINRNGSLDADDIDAIMAAVQRGNDDPRYSFTNDTILDQDDIYAWIENAAKTYFGDANLDGEFNSADFIQIFQADTYEKDVDAGWATGDWTGDRRFNSEDLVRAFAIGAYEIGPRTTAQAVPEPISPYWAWLVMTLGLRKVWRNSHGSFTT
ncbi:MAG: hypothetical protein KDA87_02595 [Planctomycetales bacterium]|nr:hypothetical protein [Planctomycetales bacterium]